MYRISKQDSSPSTPAAAEEAILRISGACRLTRERVGKEAGTEAKARLKGQHTPWDIFHCQENIICKTNTKVAKSNESQQHCFYPLPNAIIAQP